MPLARTRAEDQGSRRNTAGHPMWWLVGMEACFMGLLGAPLLCDKETEPMERRQGVGVTLESAQPAGLW